MRASVAHPYVNRQLLGSLLVNEIAPRPHNSGRSISLRGHGVA